PWGAARRLAIGRRLGHERRRVEVSAWMAERWILASHLRAGCRPDGTLGARLRAHYRSLSARGRSGLGFYVDRQHKKTATEWSCRGHLQRREYGDQLPKRQRISFRVGCGTRICSGSYDWCGWVRLSAAHG